MKLDHIQPLDTGAWSNPVEGARNSKLPDREIVVAMQALNKSQLLGQEKQLVYRRDPKTGAVMIQILNRGTGDVLDQIPAEVMLRLRADLEQEMSKKATPEDPTLA